MEKKRHIRYHTQINEDLQIYVPKMYENKKYRMYVQE